MVFSGFVIAWRFAICPTSRSPLSVIATTEGVVRLPSALAMTTGSPPLMIATHEFVVPRSMPMTLPMCYLLPMINQCQPGPHQSRERPWLPRRRHVLAHRRQQPSRRARSGHVGGTLSGIPLRRSFLWHLPIPRGGRPGDGTDQTPLPHCSLAVPRISPALPETASGRVPHLESVRRSPVFLLKI